VVRLGGAVGSGALAVAVEHRAGAPATREHQVALAASGCPEGVRPRVPEHVRMQTFNPGLSGTALEHGVDAIR
jgi:hypothetical protein